MSDSLMWWCGTPPLQVGVYFYFLKHFWHWLNNLLSQGGGGESFQEDYIRIYTYIRIHIHIYVYIHIHMRAHTNLTPM